MKRLVWLLLALAGALVWLLVARDAERAEARSAAPVEAPLAPAPLDVVEFRPVAAGAGAERESRLEDEPAAAVSSGPWKAAWPGDEAVLFHGIARDALSGLPIEAARALVNRSQRGAWPAELAAEDIECEAVSDAQGRFRLSPPRQIGHAHLLAEGYGPATFVFDGEHQTPERAEVIDLLPAAELEVRVRDPHGAPLEWITVEVARPAEAVYRVDLVMSAPEPGRRAEHTDMAGVASFTGLCAETLLAWTVRDPTRWREGRLALAPGEVRRLDVVLGGDARVAGRVVDEKGAPVADLDLSLAPESNRTRRGEASRALETTSDASGEFEFRGVPFDAYGLGFRSDAFVEHVEPVVVDRPWIERDLHLTRGTFLSGRVVGKAALNGLASAHVRSLDGASVLDARLDERSFRIGPLRPGEYLVSASDGAVATEVMRAFAGTSDLELPVVSSHDVSFRLLGAQGSTEMDVIHLETELVSRWGEDSSQFLVPLAPGAYALSAATSGSVGLVPRFTVGAGEPEEILLELRPGAHLTLVHRAVEGVRGIRLLLDGELVPFWRGFHHADEVVPGASASLLVPAGKWTAELVEDGRVVDAQTVHVAPGERCRIVLEPR